MALETKSKLLDGQKLVVQQMSGMMALKTWPRIVKILSGALKKMPGGFNGIMDMELSQLGEMLGEVCEKLTEEELDLLCDRLLKGNAWLDNEDIILAIDLGKFKGGIFAVYQAIWFAIEVNYSSFYKGLVGVKAEMASPSQA